MGWRPRSVMRTAKESPRIEVRGSNPRLDLREQDLPWAHYSILLSRREHKLPPVPRARENAWSRVAVASSLPLARAVAIAAMNAVKRRGLGLCGRRKGVIGKVKRGGRRVGSRPDGVENVRGTRRDGRPLTPRRAVESREGHQQEPPEHAGEKKLCDRPGCHVRFRVALRTPSKRFCSSSCHKAFRRALVREKRWQGACQRCPMLAADVCVPAPRSP